MSLLPAYTPLFDRLLEFAIRPENEAEVTRARGDYFSWTGEVFDEDRSFDVRMQAFLDWFVFDRVLAASGDSAARAFTARLEDPDEAFRFRLLSRTVHGIFEVRDNGRTQLDVHDLITAADYRVPGPGPLAGVRNGDLFEGRLVPFDGRFHFSSAFLFHPAHLKRRILRQIPRDHRGDRQDVQEIIWTLSRMANRAEHYRNVPVDAIYDFHRPPPKVSAPPMRFDAASLEARRQRLAGGAAHAREAP